MKIVLINDEGQSIASFEPPVRPEDRSPAQAFALLDLLEKFLARCGPGYPAVRHGGDACETRLEQRLNSELSLIQSEETVRISNLWRV